MSAYFEQKHRPPQCLQERSGSRRTEATPKANLKNRIFSMLSISQGRAASTQPLPLVFPASPTTRRYLLHPIMPKFRPDPRRTVNACSNARRSPVAQARSLELDMRCASNNGRVGSAFPFDTDSDHPPSLLHNHNQNQDSRLLHRLF